MQFSLSKASRLVFVAMLMIGAIAFMNLNPNTPSYAQGDAQTPDALCDAAEITEPETRRFSGAEQVLEEGVDYYAIFCTGNGAVYVDLYEDFTPITVNNFVFLAESGYYNNSTFHRVIADFMAQGGDPVGTPPGTGGPGYQFEDEFTPYLVFERPGLLAMANAGPATNGSQFFITRVPTTHLNGAHTIFGEVLEGQPVIDTMPDTEGGSEPESLDTILIIEDPSTVDTSYEAPAPATGREALAAVEELFERDPNFESEDAAVLDDFEAATERFGEAATEIATELYGDAFNFEAGGYYGITNCEEDTPLLGIGVRLTNWDSTEAAQEFVTSEQLDAFQAAQNFQPLPDPAQILLRNNFTTDRVYSRGTTSFCDRESTYVRYIWNLRRYTVELDIVIDDIAFGDGGISRDDIPGVVANFGYQLTPVFADVLLNSDNDE